MMPDSKKAQTASASTHDDVVPVLLPIALESPYSYLVPDGLGLGPGDIVRVPLGPREMVGVVWRGESEEEASEIDPAKLRAIIERYDCPPLTGDHLAFIDWVASYSLSPVGSVLRMTLRVPAALHPPRPETGYVLAGPPPERMTAQRARVIDVAKGGLAWRASELAAAAGVTASVVRGLIDAGTLGPVALPAFAPFKAPDPDASRVDLNREQEEVAERLAAMVRDDAFAVALLDGVTGSGKTEVYFEAVAEAARAGRQVLVLLPEIALTPEFMDRFQTRFGVEPAGWHSGLRPRERERVWRAVATGEARIVVGARSALFLPFRDLGLIVVDEEHESAYKQEDGVIYHARDMAVVRAKIGNFPLVLSSATPALETLVNAERGRYVHLRLTERHGRAGLPEVRIIDMRAQKPGSGHWLGQQALAAIGSVLEAGEQALLFLNRRGYAPLTLCRTCGHRLACPDCDAWLVEHRFRGELMCHHCGYRIARPETCPACGAEDSLAACGPGVERLADEVAAEFPDATVSILSSDLVRTADLRDALAEIADGTVDIVIGTQLVAKGHHFPQLTLACVVDADVGLSQSDPRAGERTYQLLRQVAGRAGRADKPGIALVQTYLPDHPLMQALRQRDRAAFYDYERKAREAYCLPPYGRLAGIVVSGADQRETEAFVQAMARKAPLADGIEVLGPAVAPIGLIRGRHRYRLLVKTRRDINIQNYLRVWLSAVKPRGSIRIKVDIDPYSFM